MIADLYRLNFQPFSFIVLWFTSRFNSCCTCIRVSPRPSEGTRVLAPCGFPLDDALAELHKEKQNLVNMSGAEIFGDDVFNVFVVFWGGNPT